MSVAAPPEPRIMLVPESRSSAGREAIDLAARCGLELDPWQELVIEHALGERSDGRWSAVEVGMVVPRQNGKNVVLAVRELAGLFLLGEELVIHSAQQFKTALEHFLRMLELIESTPELAGRIQRVIRSHGEEGIILKGGQRLLFFARGRSSGRGFSAPLVVFDEAMFLPETAIGAMLPTQAAMPHRQRWYAGSAVDETVHADGLVFTRLRERALRGKDHRLAFFEWSVEAEKPEDLTETELADEEAWSRANPGLDVRISREAVGDELRSMAPRTFAVERLCVGAWPELAAGTELVISLERWTALIDEESELAEPVFFAFDVTPDRSAAAIAAAGRRMDNLFHVEITHHKAGVRWLIPELARLRERWRPRGILCDATGPAGSLVKALAEEARFEPEAVSAAEHAKACGQLVDLVDGDELRHLGSSELVAALKGATRRPLGDAWAWSRKNSGVDISPLVAATLALWGAASLPPRSKGGPRIL